jgi:hypothetical protein
MSEVAVFGRLAHRRVGLGGPRCRVEAVLLWLAM